MCKPIQAIVRRLSRNRLKRAARPLGSWRADGTRQASAGTWSEGKME
jgi:hypothetical protein